MSNNCFFSIFWCCHKTQFSFICGSFISFSPAFYLEACTHKTLFFNPSVSKFSNLKPKRKTPMLPYFFSPSITKAFQILPFSLPVYSQYFTFSLWIKCETVQCSRSTVHFLRVKHNAMNGCGSCSFTRVWVQAFCLHCKSVVCERKGVLW